jgi:hypothetical protein
MAVTVTFCRAMLALKGQTKTRKHGANAPTINDNKLACGEGSSHGRYLLESSSFADRFAAFGASRSAGFNLHRVKGLL